MSLQKKFVIFLDLLLNMIKINIDRSVYSSLRE